MRRSTWLFCALVTTTLGCGGEKKVTGPTGGELTVAYSTALSHEGAMLLLISGGVVENVTPVGGYQVAFASVGANAIRVVVTGNLTAGDVIRIKVPDLSLVSSYSAHVDAAADRTTFGLNEPTLYTATVRK